MRLVHWLVFLLFCHFIDSIDVWDLFSNTSLVFPTNSTLQAIEFILYFVNNVEITAYDEVIVTLPRFTRRSSLNDYSSQNYDIEMGSVRIAPSTKLKASWTEGKFLFSNTTPFYNSQLRLKTRFNQTIAAYTSFELKVYPSNGIGTYCGFPSSFVYHNFSAKVIMPQFTIETNVTNSTHIISKYDGIGSGCSHLNDCNGNGKCDYCYQRCYCSDGYGSSNDIITIGKDIDRSCTKRICPSGKDIRGVPLSSTIGHLDYVECSNAGICNRTSGECHCFLPFTGGACERTTCPNDCSGHGQCMSMRDMAKVYGQRDSDYFFEYGTGLDIETTAWDHDVMYGCVCDSSWKVGYYAGETQLPEYFGADCSLRHCPSGDNPFTPNDEEDCNHVSQTGSPGRHRGLPNNRCQVDCSNRGICDYKTGKCSCFEGSWGDACDLILNQGTKEIQVPVV